MTILQTIVCIEIYIYIIDVDISMKTLNWKNDII